MTAWDTDLGRWRLAWVEYLRAQQPQVAPSDRGCFWRTETDEAGGFRLVPLHSLGPLIVDEPAPETADDAFAREIALAHEVCDDEREADAAVGVMPAPLVVYGPPGGEA